MQARGSEHRSKWPAQGASPVAPYVVEYFLPAMSRPFRIEGYAIVSADGMIANVEGVMPDALKIEADQRFFHCSLDRAGAVAHGRHSQETDAGAPQRRRLILTRRAARPARGHRRHRGVRAVSCDRLRRVPSQPSRQGIPARRAPGVSRRRTALARGPAGGAWAKTRCGANAR